MIELLLYFEHSFANEANQLAPQRLHPKGFHPAVERDQEGNEMLIQSTDSLSSESAFFVLYPLNP